MISWNYDPANVADEFELIPEGEHRVRIAEAEETVSKTGRDMIKLTLDVSAHRGKLFYYIVFMPDNAAMTNRSLKQLWESFGIATGNMNTASWVGKTGAARVKHEEYNGRPTARIAGFVEGTRAASLPAWQEKADRFVEVPFSENDLPF